MANQEQSSDGRPHKDGERPSPDVDSYTTDGQSNARGMGATDEQGGGGPTSAPGKGASGAEGKDYRGDGPGKIGVTSDNQPDLVAPSGVNEGDHGAAGDKPMGGGSINLDDDPEERPRGDTSRTGGTWAAQGGDSGQVGKAPGPGLSDRNGPSDPDR